MTADHAWEKKLLLALLREDAGSSDAFLRAGGDWMAFVALVVRHGVAGYLIELLARRGGAATLLPASVCDQFESERRRIAYANLLLFTGSRRLLQSLAARGIAPIVLKGPALFGRAYSDSGARLLSDIDLLVPPERAGDTIRLVQESGMTEVWCDQKAARRLGYETGGPAGAMIEIHWDLSQKHRFQADIAGLWQRSVPFELEGVAVRRLAPVDEFLYLSLHHAAHYFSVSIKWLVDLRELLRHDAPDAGELARRAKDWGGQSALHFAGRYLGKVYPAIGNPARELPAMPLRDLLARPFLSDDPFLIVDEQKRGPGRLAMGLLFVDHPIEMIRLGWVTLGAGDSDDHPHGH